MKDEYDFTNAERGKFFRPREELRIPVYLEENVLSYLQDKKGDANLSSVVDEILRKEIAILKALEP